VQIENIDIVSAKTAETLLNSLLYGRGRPEVGFAGDTDVPADLTQLLPCDLFGNPVPIALSGIKMSDPCPQGGTNNPYSFAVGIC